MSYASVMCSDIEWTCANHVYKCFNRCTVDCRMNRHMTHLIIVILTGSEMMWWVTWSYILTFLQLQMTRTLTVICFQHYPLLSWRSCSPKKKYFLLTLMLLQTQITFNILWNIKVYLNVHTALFHKTTVNGECFNFTKTQHLSFEWIVIKNERVTDCPAWNNVNGTKNDSGTQQGQLSLKLCNEN